MHYISEQEKQTNPHLELCNFLSLIKVINVLSSSKSYPMTNLIFVFVFLFQSNTLCMAKSYSKTQKDYTKKKGSSTIKYSIIQISMHWLSAPSTYTKEIQTDNKEFQIYMY